MKSPKPARKTRVLVAGWIFLLVTALVQLAAFNTGSNLLYLVAAATLGFFVIAYLFGRTNLARVHASRQLPATAHRNEAFSVSVTIQNGHRFLPLLSIVIEHATGSGDGGTFVARVPARKSTRVVLEETFRRRGAHSPRALTIRSRFPFGLLEREIRFSDGAEILVYPRINLLRSTALEQMAGSGDAPRIRAGDGEEFFGLREYVPGDDIRLISWRVSARYRKLIVHELEPTTAHHIVIIFDTRGLFDTPELEELFEEAVDLTASLAALLCRRQFAVALQTPDSSVAADTGRSQLKKILDRLARTEPVNPESCSESWFAARGDLAMAGRLYVAADPGLWGEPTGYRGSRVLDPREVVRG